PFHRGEATTHAPTPNADGSRPRQSLHLVTDPTIFSNDHAMQIFGTPHIPASDECGTAHDIAATDPTIFSNDHTIQITLQYEIRLTLHLEIEVSSATTRRGNEVVS
ncbi:hypothetical protein ACJ73_09854, partial [Blastomyces percursus]